ncbi:AP-3 complex subunit beta [Malassezia cuniculi]|uniref:AP-3 complex subunit beta n=1 Tax=Malassezia cuniculi TaxID=948313 RepID=A0AAF0ESB0_9BASI|nr:AP-3 complex subunit beta [Malassezia cuniculi]
MSLAYANSTRALAFLKESGEDALIAVKSMLGSSSAKYLEMEDDNVQDIRPKLESSSDTERLEGLRRVVALISKGRDASPYFASVSKLASTSSIEIRKLVYIIVLRYAPSHPDIALLSINSFQRDLTDPNPLIRGMALRTLSGMRLRMLSPIVLLAVGKAVRDSHPYVRKIAVLALPKCYRMEPNQYPEIVQHLETFLRDRSPYVLGPAVVVFAELCPTNWQILHRHFRRICHALQNMEPWSLGPAIDVLIRYSRRNIARPQGTVDEDLQLFLTSAEPLLSSADEQVAMAAIRALYYLSPELPAPMVRTVVRLVQRSRPESAYIAATAALAIANAKPAALAPFLSAFFVRCSDPDYLGRIKIRVLVRIVQRGTVPLLANELRTYTRSSGIVAVESVTAIGQLAEQHTSVLDHALKLLLDVAQNATSDAVAGRAVQVAKALIQSRTHTADAKDALATASIIARLAMHLFTPLTRSKDALPRIIVDPTSRSDVLWMLGQYCSLTLPIELDGAADTPLAALVAPDVLRCIVGHWQSEAPAVKTQALTLSSKVMVVLQNTQFAHARAVLMLHYELLALAERDDDVDVRDRARFYSGLTRRLDGEMSGEVPHDVEAYIAAHESKDKYRLAGVRLRREQVRHVLFEQDEKRPVRLFQLDASPAGPVGLTGFAPVAHGVRLGQWEAQDIPEWNDPDKLPSPIVRVPDAQSLDPAPMKSISSSSMWVDSERSIASENSAPPTSISSAAAAPEKVVLVPTATVEAPKKRYQDLDSFLDASSEDEPVLDDSAPEDSDYTSE